MTEGELAELLDHCPLAYHMAERGAWQGITADGLLSTTALLDLYEISGLQRNEIESCRRDHCFPITAQGKPGAVIRDQLPMDDVGLVRCLPPDITPRDWYEFLNKKVFFWLTESRLFRLTEARAYRQNEHEVLVVNTRKLVEEHYDSIWLCPMNSGTTKPMPHPRDYSIFSRISDYPYANWRSKRPRGERVVELCVDNSVPNILDFVEDAYVIKGRERVSSIL